ncbi:hypothetical protein L9F63_009430 [Diploptera punctata]|uniref:Tubulin--tyrosine ligase-like protein 12 SET-like domain-containing protein n=1 Tax=Diploptera punctata TaxID=6984 RepID=A0AAD8ESA7_DIPPU|nr:hypothetical protein L9F63_009430 [Diploptera punctata]
MQIERDGISAFHNFVAYHSFQLESSGVPKHFWEVLCKKLNDQIFDAGNTFELLKFECENRQTWKVTISREDGVDIQDPIHIYLIDHAWTYRVGEAKHHLRVVSGLLERMKSLMSIEDNDCTTEDAINNVFNEMWKYNQTYSIASAISAEERTPIWYIMDEFGTAIQHSDEPTFRAVPFIHLPQQVPYTILFPVKNLEKGEEVTRDYVEGPFTTPDLREVLLLPWFPKSFSTDDFKQDEPDENYFLEGHTVESLPEENEEIIVSYKEKMKVYSQYRYVNDYLNHPKFEITCNENEADILWLTQHFTDYRELREKSPTVFVNQFPFENVITIKDLLCIVSRRVADNSKNILGTLETEPAWLPTTFTLQTELRKFVSYYQRRHEEGLDNHWICKPWNLARGLDTHVTDNFKLYC